MKKKLYICDTNLNKQHHDNIRNITQNIYSLLH